MKEKKLVAIFVLNWNGWRDTLRCLDSLLCMNHQELAIIVFDNGSKDDSVIRISDWMRRYFPGRQSVVSWEGTCSGSLPRDSHMPGQSKSVTSQRLTLPLAVLVTSHVNLGFAGGCNAAIEYAEKSVDYDFGLLLNNDTIVDTHLLEPMIDEMENDNRIGLIGPIILDMDNGRIQSAGGNYGKGLGRRHYPHQGEEPSTLSTPFEVDCISGAAIMFRREIVRNVGMLDTDFFAYTEDVDWCYRVKGAGYRVKVHPGSRIRHKGMASSGGDSGSLAPFLVYRNSVMFMRKHAKWHHWPRYFIQSAPYGFRAFCKAMIRNPKQATAMIKGVLWNVADIVHSQQKRR